MSEPVAQEFNLLSLSETEDLLLVAGKLEENMCTLEERFKLEFEVLASNPQPIMLQLTKVQAWVLFSHLQLALRHPENHGPAADIARRIAVVLQDAVTATPTLAEVALMGWTEDLYDAIQ